MFSEATYNVAFDLILTKRTGNKGALPAAILRALHDAGHNAFILADVKKFVEYAVYKTNLVRRHIPKANRTGERQAALLALHVRKKHSVTEFRIVDSLEKFMNADNKARWSQQLADAKERANAWAMEHEDFDPRLSHAAAARNNLEVARRAKRARKAAVECASPAHAPSKMLP